MQKIRQTDEMIHDLYLRAHVEEKGAKRRRKKQVASDSRSPQLWSDYALVFDTETTIDLEQKLNFGIWHFCERQGSNYVAIQEGIFYNDELSSEDRQTIAKYQQQYEAAKPAKAYPRDLGVLSRSDFVAYVFWEAVRAGAMIVGFNLPFDIARISVRWKEARNGGFSFILSELSEKRVANVHRPRIRIAPLNGIAQKIELTAVMRKSEQSKWRRGSFLDLHTLAFALTDKSYSLAGAIRAFGSGVEKMEHEPTGKVTLEEIEYAHQDVRATVGLLNALKREYERHPITVRPERAYSPASIGKGYLRAMGIAEPMEQFKDIYPVVHGIGMAAYFGGRAECRIRRWPVPIVPVDLTSEYPSVDALLGVWNILTAERLEIIDVTKEIREFLKTITLDSLFRPALWKSLNFYARIIPDGDVVPVRSVYDSKSGTRNIGLNELEWKPGMWLAGPDLVSIVLNGRIPNVVEAIMIVPHGKQRSLKPIKLRGEIYVDPRTEDFFTKAIEYRKQNKHNDRLQYFLKILANSTSYGAYLELNPVKKNRKKRTTITVFSGDLIKEQRTPDVMEQPGSFYFPLLGALITAGGRLLLAMIERCVSDLGGTYLCCDTDALTIVASKKGGTVAMPEGAPPIKALSWNEVEGITRRFDSLSPYNRKIVPNLLRLTDENLDKNGDQRQLFGLSIAAKRYVLYTKKCGKPYCNHKNCISVVDPKAHGLIFAAPDDERKDGLPKWWRDLWDFILRLEFKQIMEPDFTPLMVAGRVINPATATAVEAQPWWISLPAMMKMRISTPHYLMQMKGKVSPFGFVLHPCTRSKAKLTLLRPFTKDRSSWAKSRCINTHDGTIQQLNEIPRTDIITLGDVLCAYLQHPEIKSLGPDGQKCKPETRGLLRRMPIKGGLQHPIGKEVSRFDDGRGDFVENINDACIQYDGGRVAANESLIAKIKREGTRKTTKLTGLDRKTIRNIANGKKVKASTLAKVVMGLRAENSI